MQALDFTFTVNRYDGNRENFNFHSPLREIIASPEERHTAPGRRGLSLAYLAQFRTNDILFQHSLFASPRACPECGCAVTGR